ncbi:MAG: RES family NAD+ phosphorylase [Rhodothalassiaceae bacterium]
MREAFPRTIRLVASARLREAVLAPLADGADERDMLAEIEGATSGRLIAEQRGLLGLARDELVHGVPYAHFINASFAYGLPRRPTRFSPPGRGAWYAALALETSIAEVGYHLTRALADAGDFHAVVDYAELIASMSGLFVDLRGLAGHPALDPDPETGYQAGNVLAAKAHAHGLNGIVYSSVRRRDGTCIAALRPNVVQSVTEGAVVRLVWSGTPDYSVRAP